MQSTCTHDYILQQAGLIQNVEISKGIHDSILRNAALMQSTKAYQPIWSSWNRNNPIKWIVKMIRGLFTRDRRTPMKRNRKEYPPVTAVPGKSTSI